EASDLSGAINRVMEYSKPRKRRLLVVEDDPAERLSIRELIHHDDIEIETVDSGAAALTALREQEWDCMVLDLKLPDMSGFDVLKRIADEKLRDVPVVVFTGRELSA